MGYSQYFQEWDQVLKANPDLPVLIIHYEDMKQVRLQTPRVKSGKFGQSAKFGQRSCLIHILIILIIIN